MPGSLRPDIEQIISAPAVDLHQEMDDLLRIFPVAVVLIEAPCIIQRCRNFPVPFIGQARDKVVPRRHILSQPIADPSADDAVRLQALHQVHHLLALFPGRAHGGIKPDQRNLPILCQQFPKLWETLPLQICAVVLSGVVLSVHVAVRVVPVLSLGIVKAEFHAAPVAGFTELPYDIPAVRSRLYHIVVAALGIPHGKAFVVLGGKYNVLHPPLLCLAHDPIRVKFHRIELCGQLLILFCWDIQVVHDPLCDPVRLFPVVLSGQERIQPPVNEQAELGLLKPLLFCVLHFFVSPFFVSRNVLLLM